MSSWVACFFFAPAFSVSISCLQRTRQSISAFSESIDSYTLYSRVKSVFYFSVIDLTFSFSSSILKFEVKFFSSRIASRVSMVFIACDISSSFRQTRPGSTRFRTGNFEWSVYVPLCSQIWYYIQSSVGLGWVSKFWVLLGISGGRWGLSEFCSWLDK